MFGELEEEKAAARPMSEGCTEQSPTPRGWPPASRSHAPSGQGTMTPPAPRGTGGRRGAKSSGRAATEAVRRRMPTSSERKTGPQIGERRPHGRQQGSARQAREHHVGAEVPRQSEQPVRQQVDVLPDAQQGAQVGRLAQQRSRHGCSGCRRRRGQGVQGGGGPDSLRAVHRARIARSAAQSLWRPAAASRTRTCAGRRTATAPPSCGTSGVAPPTAECSLLVRPTPRALRPC